MTQIIRDPDQAAGQDFDLIIVGAGIYGIALALTASQTGLRVLLLEKKDFGWATSYNSLRTIHGGLRYLQNLDLPRFFESVAERRWFLQEFPDLVRPLPCLMPLYGNGAYRPSVFRVALRVNDLLSRNRNLGLAPEQRLPDGMVISKEEVIRIFPGVDREGLRGGAVWYDGAMPSSQLVLMEMLKRACNLSTTALNYMEAKRLLTTDNRVRGVQAVDQETGREYFFPGTRVINAAGPWCRTFAARFDRDDPSLFRYSIAWNVLFRTKALSSHSVAVRPKRPGARMYFLHGWNGHLMGGTIHAPWPGVEEHPKPGPKEIDAFIDDLNLAMPGLGLSRDDVLHIYSGLLPVREQGSDRLAVREVIVDHVKRGGPEGVFSVSGVKFTTARKVAEKTLRQLFPGRVPLSSSSVRTRTVVLHDLDDCLFPHDWVPSPSDASWREKLQRIIADQAVLHLDDLVIRRTTIGDNPESALAAAPLIADLFSWDKKRRQREIRRLTRYYWLENGKRI